MLMLALYPYPGVFHHHLLESNTVFLRMDTASQVIVMLKCIDRFSYSQTPDHVPEMLSENLALCTTKALSGGNAQLHPAWRYLMTSVDVQSSSV